MAHGAMTAFALRPYQEEARTAIARDFLDGKVNRVLIAHSTGLGKTELFARLAQEPRLATWRASLPARQRKTLILAHREELIDQAAHKVSRANPGARVDVEMADRRASPHADIVVASIQTLAAVGGRRLRRFSPDDFRLVIVDESHHATSASYIRVLHWFRFLALPKALRDEDDAADDDPESALAALFEPADLAPMTDPNRLLVGVTATPKRGDGVGLEAVFQTISHAFGIREGIEAGYLSRLRALRIVTGTDLSAVKVKRGDFDEKQLEAAVDTSQRNDLIVSAWLKQAEGRKSIAFTVGVAHAHHLAEMFRARGVTAEAADGSMDKDERRAILARFRAGATRVLVNCNVFTEGFDEPSISCVVMARPTKSALLYTQIAGRGTRICEGKSDCLILDFCDLARRHSLCAAPTLFGLAPTFDAKGDDVLAALQKIEKIQQATPGLDLAGLMASKDAVSLADVKHAAEAVDLWAVPALETDVARATSLDWLLTGRDSYRLSWRLEKDAPSEALTITTDLLGHATIRLEAWSPTEPPRAETVGTAPTVLEALRTAERWLLRDRPAVVRLRRRGASYGQVPATPGQVAALERMRIPIPAGLTKGEASRRLDLMAARRAARA